MRAVIIREKVPAAPQRQNLSLAFSKQLKHRNTVEPAIGHVKHGYRIGRNYLAHVQSETPSMRCLPQIPPPAANQSGEYCDWPNAVEVFPGSGIARLRSTGILHTCLIISV